MQLEVSLGTALPTDGITVLLTFGVQFGDQGSNGTLRHRDKTGSGKMLIAKAGGAYGICLLNGMARYETLTKVGNERSFISKT